MGSSCSSRQSGKDSVSIKSEDSQPDGEEVEKIPEPKPELPSVPPVRERGAGGGSRFVESDFSSCGDDGATAGTPLSSSVDVPCQDSLRMKSKEKIEKVPSDNLPDLTLYDSSTRDILQGKIQKYKRKSKRVYICIFGDPKDSINECIALEKQLSSLQIELQEKGVELIIFNPDISYLFPEAPSLAVDSMLKFINGETVKGNIVCNLVLLNETIGGLVPPSTIVKGDYDLAVNKANDEEKQLLLRWYTENVFTDNISLKLHWPDDHSASLQDCQQKDYRNLFSKVGLEFLQIPLVLWRVFPNDLRTKYLETPLELVVRDICEMKPPKESTTIWVERSFKKKPEKSSDRYGDFFCQNESEESKLEHLKKLLSTTVEQGYAIKSEVIWGDSRSEEKYLAEMCSKVLPKVNDALQLAGITTTKIKHYVEDGVKIPVLEEICSHHDHCRSLSSQSIGREDIHQGIKEYLEGDCQQPLLLHGDPECGMSSIVAQAVLNCAKLIPEASVVERFIGLTKNSTLPEGLLYYLFEHCLLLLGDHNLQWGPLEMASKLCSVWGQATAKRPLIIIIDGLDQLDCNESVVLPWIPETLPNNVKVILTTTGNSEALKNKCKEIHVQNLSETCAKELLGVILEENSQVLPDQVWSKMTKSETSFAQYYIMILSRLILCSRDQTEYPSFADSGKCLFKTLENIFLKEPFQMLVGCLTQSCLGLSDSEAMQILNYFYGDLKLAATDFVRLVQLLGPLLLRREENGVLLSTWSSASIRRTACELYLDTPIKKNICRKFFKENILKMKPGVSFRDLDFASYSDKVLSVRCLQEGSCISLQTTGDFSNLFNANWLMSKISKCGPFKVLDDVNEALKKFPNNRELVILKDFLVLSSSSLEYDAMQLFTQLYGRLKWKLKDEPNLRHLPTLLAVVSCPPSPSLISLAPCLTDTMEVQKEDVDTKTYINSICRIKNNPQHIVTISTNGGVVAVWNINNMKPVRTLTGINQPRKLEMIDDSKCILLCGRELRIYNLDEGKYLMKLREVMNQKMPFFGLYDSDHVVALSRSRMYVNMMNLTEGTCVTTFKVGEDRFLNSLMVSDNGKICVCGDDSQKPSALLVWNLEMRKLMYDLGIPNHEFTTRLAAITSEGNYVSCVCRELDEPVPNFIVVYDLQSGTLFKRWKPGVNTISIAISTAGTCVVVGLENSSIMAYDLIIGNPRWTIQGHSAPADTLKMDVNGRMLLSYDSTGKDRSLRVWDLNTGGSLAALTPDQRITACELANDGDAVVVTLEGHVQIFTFMLCHNQIVSEVTIDQLYGNLENKGKVFDLGQAQVTT